MNINYLHELGIKSHVLQRIACCFCRIYNVDYLYVILVKDAESVSAQ